MKMKGAPKLGRKLGKFRTLTMVEKFAMKNLLRVKCVMEIAGVVRGNSWNENVNEEVGRDGDGDGDVDGYGGVDGDRVEEKEEKSRGRTRHYPLWPEAEDCAFYMKNGTCKFGFSCKFNHPIRRKNQLRTLT